MGGASSFSTNTHGWRGPPGPGDSSVIPTFRHSQLPSFPPSVIPAFRRSRLTRHSCLLLFRPSVIPARLPSFLPSVVPARLPSFPPSVILPSRRSHLPSFPRKRESKVVRPMPAFLSQRSLDSRFRGNDGRRGNDGCRGNDGNYAGQPRKRKGPAGPADGH